MSEVYQDYFRFIEDFLRLHKTATNIQLGQSKLLSPQGKPSGKSAMIFSPHPDDEALMGPVCNRLRRDEGFDIFNVAVTLGSNQERRAGRKEELSGACKTLGYKMIFPNENGFDNVNSKGKKNSPEIWAGYVKNIKNILLEKTPEIIIFPHERDWNSSHIGTNILLMDALAEIAKNSNYSPLIFETEFWHEIESPNFLLGLTPADEALIVFALSAHKKEVERNPYHTLHPARALNNVLRGSEVVGGQGGDSTQMDFAVLYNITKFKEGKLIPAFEGTKVVTAEQNFNEILKLI